MAGSLAQIAEHIAALAADTPSAVAPATTPRGTARPPPARVAPRPPPAARAAGAALPASAASAATTPVLPGVDPKLAHAILDEALVERPDVRWTDIIGLAAAKQALYEAVVLPSKRPELFRGLRAPARGVLLYGPPGTGKTMLAKAVAHESRARFFAVSAASLLSKWLGEGEKTVRALFAVARATAPAIIFIDEIDSLLKARSENEHEASRRIKTEFFLQSDGLATDQDERLLVLGATNRPQELDAAALRRFPRRIYIPLPEPATRGALLAALLEQQPHTLTPRQLEQLVARTDGYSGSDLTALAREASMGPLRELGDRLCDVPVDQIRALALADFLAALKEVRPSVPAEALQIYEAWAQYGSQGQ
ncbi:hypothetical protein CXG81DRAFT_14830 [Caulochytrium protostelioides]|uniref:microtubule-severing ATPase n=1 Tax=Caulochytrium protostelioides TaxID=1555241 RepID=A0A4P9X058_9FUNG|nr:hypothetical protein CXG81DRAFT_14830 [Caulochytrium protostelioides]|eukprot:RKO99204.1 hypothetical protein CXG81DRAFT_14830 [Caulochytrium protostelioides]